MNIPVHYIDGQPLQHKLTFGDVILVAVLLLMGAAVGIWLAFQVLTHWVSFEAPQAVWTASQQPSDVQPLSVSQ